MAPKVVCDTVLSLVKEGFLQQVLGSALLQVKPLYNYIWLLDYSKTYLRTLYQL